MRHREVCDDAEDYASVPVDTLGAFEEALGEIPAELQDVRGHVVVLLSQTLWALGTDEGRETAKNQLLEW